MAIPKYYEFVKPILLFLKDEMLHKCLDMYEKFAIQFHLTEEEMALV